MNTTAAHRTTFPLINRRNFERFVLGEDARVLDESGRELGRASHAGGGGMRIEANSLSIAQEIENAKELRLLVFEPNSNITHKVTVAVRYRTNSSVGVEFLSISE